VYTPKRTRGRLAWLAGGSLFSVAVLGWGSIQIVSLLAHERSHTHTVISAPVSLVDVSSGGGSVRIEGTTDPAVTIDASISEGLFSSSHHETVQGDRLVVRSNCTNVVNTFCRVNYTIRMPERLPLKVHSTGGAITVNNVNGDLDLSSSGGGVHVTGGHGQMRVRSSGGAVNAIELASPIVDADSSGGGVRLSFAQPPTTVKVSSSGGGVRVEVPMIPDGYAVDARSSGGATHNNVRTDPASTHTIRARSSGGGVRIDYLTAP
jgi:hypothetical protein